MKLKIISSWLLRLIAAIILLQTLYFKFAGHPESVELFTKLGVEPWGRIGTGIIELIAGVLLIIPATAFLGGLLGIGLMAGAILSHVTIIGIESAGDGGQLFILAIVVLVCSVITVWQNRMQGTTMLKRIFR
jgi:uncharacterized membrane protein YphA (DoxX/SURF4 family)